MTNNIYLDETNETFSKSRPRPYFCSRSYLTVETKTLLSRITLLTSSKLYSDKGNSVCQNFSKLTKTL